MAFTEIEPKRIDKTVGELCRRRSPLQLKDKLSVEYDVERHDVLIYERRPQWDNPSHFISTPVAKLRYNRTANTWRLFWQRANSKWFAYEPAPENKDLAVLVRAIDEDRYGCFWG